MKKIASLKASLKKIQESLENSSLGKEIERINIHDKAEAPISKFKCSSCDYQARSSHGLKSHISRKHTKYDENLSSYKCEFCGSEFGTCKDLKEQMFKHSRKC